MRRRSGWKRTSRVAGRRLTRLLATFAIGAMLGFLVPTFIALARGYEYATAREWALKLKELARVFADPYSAADFEHGPVALLEPGIPVLATVRPGPTRDGLVERLTTLRNDLGAALAVASDDEAALALARWPLRLPPGTPEWLGPIVSIVVGQLHALHLTRAHGLDPEAPRNLRKVTSTT